MAQGRDNAGGTLTLEVHNCQAHSPRRRRSPERRLLGYRIILTNRSGPISVLFCRNHVIWVSKRFIFSELAGGRCNVSGYEVRMQRTIYTYTSTSTSSTTKGCTSNNRFQSQSH
jgi:hypothetical protein